MCRRRHVFPSFALNRFLAFVGVAHCFTGFDWPESAEYCFFRLSIFFCWCDTSLGRYFFKFSNFTGFRPVLFRPRASLILQICICIEFDSIFFSFHLRYWICGPIFIVFVLPQFRNFSKHSLYTANNDKIELRFPFVPDI